MDHLPLIKEGMLLQMVSQGMDAHLPDHAMDLMYDFLSLCLSNPPVSTDAFLSADFSSHGCGSGAWGSAEEDHVSAIPNEILRNIISRLPAKDAARTDVLSSCWCSLRRSASLFLVDALLVPASRHDGSLIRDIGSTSSVVTVASRVLEARRGPFRRVNHTSGSMDAHHAELMRWL